MRTAKLPRAYARPRRLVRCSQMRLLPLFLLALTACGPGPTPPDAPPPLPPGRVIETDSLLRDEPARTYRVAIGYPQVGATDGQPLPATLQAANAAVRDTVAAFADDQLDGEERDAVATAIAKRHSGALRAASGPGLFPARYARCIGRRPLIKN